MKIYNLRTLCNHGRRIYQEKYSKIYVIDNYGSRHLLGGNLLLRCLQVEPMINTEKETLCKYKI